MCRLLLPLSPPSQDARDVTSRFGSRQRRGSLRAWTRSLPFSAKTRAWFERAFAGPTPGAGRRLARDRDRRQRADPGPDRLRQDARRVPLRHRPARLDARPGPAAPLRLAAEGAQLRRRAQPPRAARRAPVRSPRRRPHRRHVAEGAARARQGAAGHPDHDARVALPDADLAGARDAARDRRR